jgi:hypothetical protein
VKLVEKLRSWLWPKPKLTSAQVKTLARADKVYDHAIREIRRLEKPH